MEISLTTIKKPIANFLHRFHIVLFVIVVLGSLAAAVFILYTIIVSSGESNGYTSQTNNATFDQATIDKIKQLKTNGQAADPATPGNGRTNPFVE